MKTRFTMTMLALLLMGFSFSAGAQCTDWIAPTETTGWTDFNTAFGGAPCDDGMGCPFNEITDFQVWASEAYSVDGFRAGGTYSFSMCNGSGAGSWVPEFTIQAPSGAIDAFGPGDGDGCTITWTASEDGTYLIIINEVDACGGGNNTATDNGFPALTCTDSPTVLCDPPVIACVLDTLATADSLIVCNGDVFTLATGGNDTIPTGGGFGWSFSNVLGGTGGVPAFTITGADPEETYDDDLNGILAANSLDTLSGLWVIRAVIYTDPSDALNTICATSPDSVIINLLGADGPMIDDVVDNGDGSATASASGGTAPLAFEWSDGQMGETASGLDAGIYEVTVTDANGCTDMGQVTIGPGGEPCETWVNPSSTSGWTDFNSTFGGAPCDDGTGCPFNEITSFEVWASEAYSVDGFQAGGTYSFSMCNGTGAGSWVPEFTIQAPSGAIDAFGPGDGDGCTITWTASEDGTYLIVINEEGACGGGDNTATDNGFPALTCMSGDAVLCDEPPMTDCSVGELVTTGITTVCGPDATFDIATDETDTIPVGGGFGWLFSDELGGTGALAGGFILTNSNPVSNFNADINGVLSSNNFDPLGGVWVITAAVYEDAGNAFNSICATSTDSLIVQFGDIPEVDITDNNDGSASVTVTGGFPPYTYAWSDGQTTDMPTGLTPGLNTVTVTDAIGCTAEGTIDIMVSVGEITGLESLYIGPNPTQGAFNLRLSLDNPEDIQVEVMNLVGQKLQVLRESNTALLDRTLDLSAQPDGVYMLRLIVGGDEITKRIVKGN